MLKVWLLDARSKKKVGRNVRDQGREADRGQLQCILTQIKNVIFFRRNFEYGSSPNWPAARN